MNVLVTGGAGYIGSHCVRELKKAGHKVVVYDNLTTGHSEAVPKDVQLVYGDIREKEVLGRALEVYEIDAVVHFAAASLVGESMTEPAKYYNNNVNGTMALLDTLRRYDVDKIVFSSTAAVYGEPKTFPITEELGTDPTNVYGRTKLVIEGMLADYARAYGLRYVALRYFNAAGALAGGDIGEDHAPETHLIPLILRTALGRRQSIDVYGTDYPTADGSCIRDYVHVTDLAAAHVLALNYLNAGGEPRIYNLGSEQGFSVREVIAAAKKITGVDFTVREVARRAGDPAVLVASAAKIKKELSWNPKFSNLETIIASAWLWHKNHPHGFK